MQLGHVIYAPCVWKNLTSLLVYSMIALHIGQVATLGSFFSPPSNPIIVAIVLIVKQFNTIVIHHYKAKDSNGFALRQQLRRFKMAFIDAESLSSDKSNFQKISTFPITKAREAI